MRESKVFSETVEAYGREIGSVFIAWCCTKFTFLHVNWKSKMAAHVRHS